MDQSFSKYEKISMIQLLHYYLSKKPGVSPNAGLAPVNERNPPSFKYSAAILAAIMELQTLCFHIKSQFFTKSLCAALPPAHPPATQIMPSTFSSFNVSLTCAKISVCYKKLINIYYLNIHDKNISDKNYLLLPIIIRIYNHICICLFIWVHINGANPLKIIIQNVYTVPE